ncbi:hypothetical protein B0T25DRAFT_257586 [Lasiosphaeria hispida]|uniref:Uncharacterized protein n=1 Tax=Lasiosphaeria hispida TaxID=260671 RepID=A0AAJ0HFS7_9PEZI|nr:hypothetical protein B0T25DRAFT_257586 [Lasiosphaeria hispida]
MGGWSVCSLCAASRTPGKSFSRTVRSDLSLALILFCRLLLLPCPSWCCFAVHALASSHLAYGRAHRRFSGTDERGPSANAGAALDEADDGGSPGGRIARMLTRSARRFVSWRILHCERRWERRSQFTLEGALPISELPTGRADATWQLIISEQHVCGPGSTLPALPIRPSLAVVAY